MGDKVTVYPAEPYRMCQLGSYGKANNMLLRQFRFPHLFDPREKLVSVSSDRDERHAERCFTQHTGSTILDFEEWVMKSTDEQLFAFLQDILRADASVVWTGYRVLGSVDWGNGHPCFHFELFSRNPNGNTEVYTGPIAPNVLPSPRDEQ